MYCQNCGDDFSSDAKQHYQREDEDGEAFVDVSCSCERCGSITINTFTKLGTWAASSLEQEDLENLLDYDHLEKKYNSSP